MSTKTLDQEVQGMNNGLVSMDAKGTSPINVVGGDKYLILEDFVLKNIDTEDEEKINLDEEIADIIDEMEEIRKANPSSNQFFLEEKDSYSGLASRLGDLINGIENEDIVSLKNYILDELNNDQKFLNYDYSNEGNFRVTNPEFSVTVDNLVIRLMGDNFSGLRVKHHLINSFKYLSSLSKEKEEQVEIYDAILPAMGSDDNEFHDVLHDVKDIKELARLVRHLEGKSTDKLTGSLKNADDFEKVLSLTKKLKYAGIKLFVSHDNASKLGVEFGFEWKNLGNHENRLREKKYQLNIDSLEKQDEYSVEYDLVYLPYKNFLFQKGIKAYMISLNFDFLEETSSDLLLSDSIKRYHSVMEQLSSHSMPKKIENGLEHSIKNHHGYGNKFLKALIESNENAQNYKFGKHKDKMHNSVALYARDNYEYHNKFSALVCFKGERYVLTTISKEGNVDVDSILGILSADMSNEEKIKSLLEKINPEYLHMSCYKDNKKYADMVVERNIALKNMKK